MRLRNENRRPALEATVRVELRPEVAMPASERYEALAAVLDSLRSPLAAPERAASLALLRHLTRE